MNTSLLSLRSFFVGPIGYLLLLICAPLPLLCLMSYFFLTFSRYEHLTEEMHRIHKKSVQVQALQQKENALLSSLSNPDHFYIDKHLETLFFLEPETKRIEAMLLENPHEESLKRRFHFLTEGPNRLLFSEVHTRQHQHYQEVEEKQQHAVEMNEEDLKRTLSLIEGVTIWPYGPQEKRPQLIIKDFQLSKKETPLHEFVYVINIDLIKRESTR